ncbi:MAG: hypothetical protein K9H25_17015 [Rhodospirillum sp.]|nr:hypothetical protein [Rhodospirillum sp.]MCF8489100.1 hypothetical protein [Rhodospirillum sp.]MCF8498890.1 hypothetical protein [Rhodospirillum sp.]
MRFHISFVKNALFSRISLTWLIPILLFLLCFGIIVAPEILVITKISSDLVWIPVGWANERVGDAYYYAAWMREVVNGPFPPISPTALEQTQFSIELFKLVPFTLAALPSLFVSDPRYQLLISIAIFPAITSVISYAFSRGFNCSRRTSFLIGIFSVFHYQLFSRLYGGFDVWISTLIAHIKSFSNIIDFELVNDNFRYINTSVSWVPTLLFIFAIQKTWISREWRWAFFAAVLAMAEWFVYMPQAFVTHLLLGSLAGISALRRDWRLLSRFSLILGASAAFLLIGGIPQMLRSASANTIFYEAIFNGELRLSPSQLWIGVKILASDSFYLSLIGKYLIFLIFMAVCSWRQGRRMDWVAALAAVITTLVGISIVFANTNSSLRFFNRGIDLIFILSAASLFGGRLNALASTGVWWARVKLVCYMFITVGAVSLPAYGFLQVGERAAHSGSHSMSKDRWQAYEWIAEHVPYNAQVAALDWQDVYELPVYAGSKLAYGHWIIDNRTAEDEYGRYLSVWKTIGMKREDWSNRIASSLPAYQKLIRNIFIEKPSRTPPYLSGAEFDDAMLAHALLYWPYHSTVNGVALAKDRPATTVSPEFIQEMERLYDQTPGDLERFGDLYIIESPHARARMGREVPGEIVFQNSTFTVYRHTPKPASLQ